MIRVPRVPRVSCACVRGRLQQRVGISTANGYPTRRTQPHAENARDGKGGAHALTLLARASRTPAVTHNKSVSKGSKGRGQVNGNTTGMKSGGCTEASPLEALSALEPNSPF